MSLLQAYPKPASAGDEKLDHLENLLVPFRYETSGLAMQYTLVGFLVRPVTLAGHGFQASDVANLDIPTAIAD